MSDWLADLARLPELRFLAPARLWFALPVLAILLLAPFVRRRRLALAPTLLRALALAALLAVLLEPVVPERDTVSGSVLVLADVSPSVGADGIDAARRFLAGAAIPYELVAVGATPADARLDDLAPDPREATDLAAALRLAAVRAPADAPLRVVLLSDGRATVPGADEAARRLRRNGAEVFAVAIPGQARANRPALAALGLHAPPVDRRREPFPLTARVRAAAASEAEVTLYLDGVAERAKTVALPAGESDIDLGLISLQPGRYYAQVVLAGDGAPFDNVAALVLDVPGVPRVLCLAREKRRALFADALRAQGLEVDVDAAAATPDFGAYDAVLILPDAPVEALEKHAAALAEFVGERGGGLVAVGGSEGEGLARLHGTPLSFLLPLEVEPRPPPEPEPTPEPEPEDKPRVEIIEEEKEAFPISLCLLVDTSGSMAQFGKIERAKAAAAAAAFALTPDDRVSVVAFGDTVGIVVPPRPAGNPRAVLQALAPLQAEGKTAMFEALRTGLAVLRKEETPIRHLVLITDGVSTDFGPWRDLATTMASEKITLSSVGIGWDIDRRLLSQLAVWGHGKYWSANHPHEIPQVVTQDTLQIVKARKRRGEDAERAPPKERKPDPEPPPPPEERKPDAEPEAAPPEAVPIVPQPAAPREMLKGIPDEDLPKVHAVEEGKPRFASWVAALAGTDGPPLLAYWRVGLGTAAALTVDPERPGELRDHRELPRLLAQLVRSVLPDAGRAPLVLEQGRERSGSDERLWVRAIAEDGLPRTDLAFELDVGDAAVPVRRGADRYEAILPERAAPSVAEVRIGPPGAPVATRRFVLPPSTSAELAETGPDRAALSRLAGHPDRLDPAPGAVLALPERVDERSRPLRLPFLLLAAILLPLDAWARRRARSASR